MADSPIRIGRVSSVNEQTGMVRVAYSDRENSVTSEMPYINYNGEYCTPAVGSMVLTAHLSNGNSRGVVLGTIWNQSNTPPESGNGLYRKDLAKTKGKAMIRYDEKNGECLIKGPQLKLEDDAWSITLSQIMERLAALDGKQSGRK